MHFDKELDVRGLNCPLPILRTKKTLAGMVTGQVLKIIATDPSTTIDFLVFTDQTGKLLLTSLKVDNEFIFHIKKK